MPRKSTKKERGVFEKDPDSEIWWIRYYIDGRERREKVGRKKDASDLYKIRKADALRGVRPCRRASECSRATTDLRPPRGSPASRDRGRSATPRPNRTHQGAPA